MGQSQSLVPFVNCFPSRSAAGSGFLSAWDLILKYYEIKNGEKYNATPARRLSQSFGLEIVGSTAITNKQVCHYVLELNNYKNHKGDTWNVKYDCEFLAVVEHSRQYH